MGVIDTGVHLTHPDVAGRVIDTHNFTSEVDEDIVGHGTHVSSIIAGSSAASNGRYKGVAPDAQLVARANGRRLARMPMELCTRRLYAGIWPYLDAVPLGSTQTLNPSRMVVVHAKYLGARPDVDQGVITLGAGWKGSFVFPVDSALLPLPYERTEYYTLSPNGVWENSLALCQLGSRLIREALRLLNARGACGCVVLGSPDYYGRFGFQADRDLVLPNVPTEYFQALSFESSKPRGVVTYYQASRVSGTEH